MENILGNGDKKWTMLSLHWGTDKPVLVVDLDGTLCREDLPENWKHYATAIPIREEIEILERLVDKYFIVIWTSRFEADRKVTEEWLARNCVPCDRLIMEKMLFSFYVDANARRSLKDFDG